VVLGSPILGGTRCKGFLTNAILLLYTAKLRNAGRVALEDLLVYEGAAALCRKTKSREKKKVAEPGGVKGSREVRGAAEWSTL